MAVSLVTLAELGGVTARQIGHWIDAGYIKAASAHPGSGHFRVFTDAEVRRVRVLCVLVHAGVAPSSARDHIQAGWFDEDGSFHAVLALRDSELKIEVRL